jgi:hypothetical protein
MDLPAEFIGRVIKTRFGIFSGIMEKLSEIQKDFPGTYVDVVYENMTSKRVLVFESNEDCTAYLLKYGKDYV